MAGAEDAVRPQFQVGNQPQPSPTFGAVMGGGAPAPQPAPAPQQTFGSVFSQDQQAQQAPQPQAEPTPAPAPEPTPEVPQQDKIDSAKVDSLIQSLAKTQKGKSGKSDTLSQADELLKSFGGGGAAPAQFDPNNPVIDPRKKDESIFDYVGRLGSEELKFLGAQNRGSLGDDKQKEIAFQSMYGPSNVQKKGDLLYFRPNPQSKFRPVDQAQLGLVTDFFARHAAEIPGIAAGAAAGTASGTALAASGSPMIGAATAPAVAGAMQGGVNSAMQSAIDGVSAIPQINTDEQWTNFGHQILKGMEINYLGGIAGAATQRLGQGIANALPENTWGLNTLKSILETQGPGRTSQEKADEIHQALVSTIEKVQNVSRLPEGSGREMEPQVGKYIADKVTSINQQLGETVGIIKNKVIQLAGPEGEDEQVTAQMPNLTGFLKTELEKYGYTFDKNGYSRPPIIGGNTANAYGVPEGEAVLRNMAKKYDGLVSQRFANDQTGNVGGISADALFNQMKALEESADFQSRDRSAINKLYGRMYRSAGSDRDAFIDQIFKDNANVPEAATWRASFDSYSQNMTSMGKLKALLQNDQTKETLVEALSQGKQSNRLRMLGGLKDILGEDSQEWDLLRGEILNNAVTKSVNTSNGVFNAGAFLNQMDKGMGPSVRNMLYSPSEVKAIMQVGKKAYDISMNDGQLKASQTEVIKSAIELGQAIHGDPIANVKWFQRIFSGNKTAIDYTMDKGLIDAAKSAETPEEKDFLMSTSRLMREMTGKMNVVDSNAEGVKVRRYVPWSGAILGTAGRDVSNQITSPSIPSPSPQPAPTPSPNPSVAPPGP